MLKVLLTFNKSEIFHTSKTVKDVYSDTCKLFWALLCWLSYL